MNQTQSLAGNSKHSYVLSMCMHNAIQYFFNVQRM